MAIKRSAGQEVQVLIADLETGDEVQREAAVARLAVIGTRAVDKLVGLVQRSTHPPALVAALHALESTGDVRALVPASSLLATPNADVAVAAVGVLRAFLHSRQDTEVIDRLVAFVLDTTRPDAARLAALDALEETGGRMLRPVWERLREDGNVAVRQRAARATGQADASSEIQAAAEGAVPEEPEKLLAFVQSAGGEMPLPTLHRLVEVLREREQQERSATVRAGWVAARGAVHLALAGRQSRVALYDLRETIERARSPLPAAFIQAIAAIGDAAALEAIASAYTAGAADAEWRRQLAHAFDAIVEREGINRRHAVARRIETKWPQSAALLSTLSRNRRASKPPSRTSGMSH